MFNCTVNLCMQIKIKLGYSTLHQNVWENCFRHVYECG